METARIRQLLLLVLVAYSIHVVVCHTSSLYVNETDRLSLLAFKAAISSDPRQAFMSWNDSTHFCNWEGVRCRVHLPRRVTSLSLTNWGLVGHISPSLGNLTFLDSLILTENTFIGEIPPSLGHLRHLRTLCLNNNTLQGRMPSFANCSKLKVLDVRVNNLVGQFPVDLPPQIEMLRVSANNLTGTIPSSLANSTTLTIITFEFNHIKGNIPSEFIDLSNLQYLFADVNQLEGKFPQAILNLSALISLGLGQNDLRGQVPANLGTTLPDLQIIALGGNFFLGNIPTSFTNASSLQSIDLAANNFTGLVPTMFGKLTELWRLNLEENQLQAQTWEDWKFLGSLGNCTELRVFSMSGNRLSGNIPSSLGNLSNQLQFLYFAENQLSGDFPSSIANFRNLISLSLAANHFTGVLPEWIGNLNNLQEIGLDTNSFTGVIPTSLSNLTQLGGIYLYSNQFTGHISPKFGNFPMLQELDISKNSLHGWVPMGMFKIPSIMRIDLSYNNLDGQLPTNIGNAKQLLIFVVSSNKLSRDIPNTLGDCESLEDIELDSNIFSGGIPTSLGNIRSLKLLNLSHNNLTGSIPTSLGNLELLRKLDLSFNHLNGEVPTRGIFKNITATRIDGNHRLCGGVLQLHMLACFVMPSNSTRHKQYLALKVVMPIASMVSLAMVIFISLLWRGKHKSKSTSLPSFATKFPRVSFNDLAKATMGFSTSNFIGRGRYSSVYQGKLTEDQKEVAIKVFNLEIRGAQKSFITECNALKNVRHRNLVPILTACSSIDSNGNDFKAIVYVLMARGDLHTLLYLSQDYEGSSNLNLITMSQRISIVVDVADALEYIHHNHEVSMVHCDLKPSNILLDENMTAHVGDFGLARFKFGFTTPSLGNSHSSSVAVMGTIGYAAPEYAGGGQVSTATDVYSFGVVLFEIIARRRPTDDMFKDGLNIVKFVEINFPERVLDIVDPQLLQELKFFHETPITEEKCECSLCSMLNVGLCCTKQSPGEPINMHEVVAKLHRIRDTYLRGN